MFNKFVLSLIAMGLLANATALWLKPAVAQSDSLLRSIDSHLSSINSNIEALLRDSGACKNPKICT